MPRAAPLVLKRKSDTEHTNVVVCPNIQACLKPLRSGAVLHQGSADAWRAASAEYDDLYPPFIPDTSAGSQANSSATSNANSSATTDAYATTDNKPRSCPDSSYEPGSDKRTREQLLYQAQINGLPFGYEVVLNGVGYDGCRESDNTMLEAKHIGPWFIYIREDYFKKMHEYEDIKDQGFRQNYSSGGRKVEWHFDDPQVANYWRNEFAKLKYDNITVKYTAYNPLYNPNIDKMLLALCGVR
jgi:hypothetical protein